MRSKTVGLDSFRDLLTTERDALSSDHAVPCLACKQEGLDENDEYCEECGGDGVLPLP